ncbi:squamosa promoter-binding protein [Trifolium repens]|nr:squamosa promoter-binding protein [Trifolium repens]
MFGRLDLSDFVLQHPTISRFHAAGEVVLDTSIHFRSTIYSKIWTVSPIVIPTSKRSQFFVEGVNLMSSATSLLDIYRLKLFSPPPMSAGYESSVAHLLFGDEEYLYIFQEAYASAMHYLYHDPWYVKVNMDSAAMLYMAINMDSAVN